MSIQLFKDLFCYTKNAECIHSVKKACYSLQILWIQIQVYNDQKSVNLQYNTLGRWVDWTNDSSTKCLMFQALFFLSFFIDLGHSKGWRTFRPWIFQLQTWGWNVFQPLKTLYFYYKKINWNHFCKEFCFEHW